MAARGISSVNSLKISRGYTTALASAVLEWLLIFLLFIDAIFSYLVTKFARYCELQVPCLLCSRLDHVLGNEKQGYYWDLICSNHKLEISSLVLCHVHNKLVDVHGMCESCLFSFATINKSNVETYRLLVGKWGKDPTLDLDQDPLLEDHKLGSSSTNNCSCCNESSNNCSCCNEPWNFRGYAQTLLQTRSIGSEAAELDQPLLGTAVHDQGDFKKRREEPSGSVTTSHLKDNGIDPLPHIGYMELKINSDTESEVLISDDDDASALVRGTNDPKEDFFVQCAHQEPRIITVADDFASEKLIHPASEPKPSLLVSQVQSDIIEPHGSTSVASTVAIGYGLEELNWQQVEHTADPSSLSELISLDDVPPSSNATETPAQESKERWDATETGEVGQTSVSESRALSKAVSVPVTTTDVGTEMKSDNGLQIPNYLDLGDAYKIAIGNRGRQLSGVLAEQWTVKDSSRVSEDLKLLLSQISAARGFELSLNDTSPRVSGNIDEIKTPDACSAIGTQILQKRISLERNESGFESLVGSIVSEIEGESVVDWLKRQIEHDRKSMSALYKELEEERNASAVSANQAMAMITRLQEDKAAFHMEALQHLRMMEDQAEYDMEALQKSNELLAEKEKEIQDLEAELEFYRNKFPNELMLEDTVESTCDSKARDVKVELSEASSDIGSATVARDSVIAKPNICHKIEGIESFLRDKSTNTLKNSLLEFEDERLYISRCLKKLEEKLHLFSNNGVELANGEYFGNEGDGVSDLKELHYKVGSQEKNSEIEGNDLSVQNDVSTSKGSVHTKGHIPSENPQIVREESIECDHGGQCSPMICKETNLVALRNEVSDLNDRLDALEADRNFLEHTINSLKNGDEGLHFIQEIASHLQELRRIGITRSDQVVA